MNKAGNVLVSVVAVCCKCYRTGTWSVRLDSAVVDYYRLFIYTALSRSLVQPLFLASVHCTLQFSVHRAVVNAFKSTINLQPNRSRQKLGLKPKRFDGLIYLVVPGFNGTVPCWGCLRNVGLLFMSL
jgi:hypothetical protein